MTTDNETVDAALINLLSQLNSCMNILSSFNDESQREPLYETLQQIIESLHSLEKLSRSKDFDGSIPLNLVELIDKGNNPDNYASKLLAEVKNIQEKVRKKQEWMQRLKDSLDTLVELNFPDMKKEFPEKDNTNKQE